MNLKYVILIQSFIYLMMIASSTQANPRGPLFEKSLNPTFCEYTEELSGEVQCGYCSTVKPTMYICKGCRVVLYCCRGHQKKDWSDHKIFCETAQRVELEKS